MAAAAGLQTATAAISVVQLAYQTYRFVGEIANAHIEARILREKTTRLYRLVKNVQSRIDIRRQIRGNAPAPEEEEDIESTVRASLKVCRQCLFRLNRKLRSLTTDQPLNLHSRVFEGFRFTISQPERLRQERALETNIQALTTSLHLLQFLEHDATGKRLDKLEKSMTQALAHLQLISQRRLSPTASPAMNSDAPAQIEAPVEEADLLAIQSLTRTIEVAQSTASIHGSSFDPDRRSSVRITVEADSDDTDEDEPEHHNNSNNNNVIPDRLPSYGDALADRPEPSQVDCIGLGIAEPIDDPVRSLRLPPAIYSQYKHDYQEAAEKEYNKGNFITAEEYQKKAFDQALQLEQNGDEPFVERKQMRRRLVDIFVKQGKHGEAAREIHNLRQELDAENTPEQVKEHAELWMRLAKVHHSMFVAGKDGINRDVAYKNIETAEIYALERAYPRLNELWEAGDISLQDEQFHSCAALMVQILEDQGKVVEAGSWRRLYLSSGPAAPLSPPASGMTDQSGESAEEDKATAEYNRQLKLLDTHGRPRISNAVVFDLPDHFQEILEDKLEAENPDLNERCQDKEWTPLMYAVACDHKASCSCELAIEKLVHHGADLQAHVGHGKDGETALHQAVAAGREDKVQCLLRKGAEKEALKPFTPLATAVKKNQARMVELLLEHGAEAPIDGNRWTLLHHAVASSAFDAFTVLIREEYRDKFDIEALCSSKKTPLLLSAEFASRPLSCAMAEELLKLGADANVRDDVGRTPLYFATNKRYDPRQTDRDNFVKLLLAHGADWEKTPEKFRGPKSPFMQYPSIRVATGRSLPGAELRRKDSTTSSMSGVRRRDSGSTFRSLDTVATRESGKSRMLNLPFGRNRIRPNS